MGELYGEINKLTMEWRDGLMAITVRVCVQVGAPEQYGFRSKLLFLTLNRQALCRIVVCSSLQDSWKSGSRKVSRKPRGSWRETRKWSLLALFSIHLIIPLNGLLVSLWLVSFGSLRQHTRPSLSSACTDSNKHCERVKPSYTAYFDILTQETVFLVVGGLKNLKRCLQALPFSLSDVFHCSLTFLARLH